MEGKHGASVASVVGGPWPHNTLRHVPGISARYTREKSRKKEYGPTSHFVTMKPSQRAQPGPSHNDDTVMGPYTPRSLSSRSRGSLTGSLIVPIATLIPRVHRSLARELTILADLSFLPSHPVETTRALGMTPPPYPLPREGETCRHIASFPFLIMGHQGHRFMPRFRPSSYLTRVTTEAVNNV